MKKKDITEIVVRTEFLQITRCLDMDKFSDFIDSLDLDNTTKFEVKHGQLKDYIYMTYNKFEDIHKEFMENLVLPSEKVKFYFTEVAVAYTTRVFLKDYLEHHTETVYRVSIEDPISESRYAWTPQVHLLSGYADLEDGYYD